MCAARSFGGIPIALSHPTRGAVARRLALLTGQCCGGRSAGLERLGRGSPGFRAPRWPRNGVSRWSAPICLWRDWRRGRGRVCDALSTERRRLRARGRTGDATRTSRVVFILTGLTNPRQAWGFGPWRWRPRIRPVPNRVPKAAFSLSFPKRRKSRWNAGLRMARPGLEPGTPRFSVVRSGLAGGAKSLEKKRFSAAHTSDARVRYLRAFARSSGDVGVSSPFFAEVLSGVTTGVSMRHST